MGRPVLDFLDPESHAAWQDHVQHLQAPEARSTSIELKARRLDGSLVDVEIVCVPFRWNNTPAFHVIARDISERKALERQIIEAATTEQERIGRDIHDGIGQRLTAIGMLAHSLERKLARAGHTGEALTAGQLLKHVQQGIAETRFLARGLAPVELDAENLPAALTTLVEEARSSSGLDITLRSSGQVPPMTSTVATHLYRIAQESVNNALKHARCRSIAVSLDGRDGGATLTVRDDGVGMQSSDHSGSRLGLSIMRYRARIIGATLTVLTNDGGGTHVRCHWPGADELS